MRAHCREVDTPARFGGDEFALVLLETTAKGAEQTAARIRERVAKDGEMYRHRRIPRGWQDHRNTALPSGPLTL